MSSSLPVRPGGVAPLPYDIVFGDNVQCNGDFATQYEIDVVNYINSFVNNMIHTGRTPLTTPDILALKVNLFKIFNPPPPPAAEDSEEEIEIGGAKKRNKSKRRKQKKSNKKSRTRNAKRFY